MTQTPASGPLRAGDDAADVVGVDGDGIRLPRAREAEGKCGGRDESDRSHAAHDNSGASSAIMPAMPQLRYAALLLFFAFAAAEPARAQHPLDPLTAG